MTQLKILALDPATKCGFAHTCGAAGTWDLSVRRDESSGMRLIRLAGKIADIHKSVGIDVLVFEAARNAGPKMQGALVVQAEFQGQIKAWCETHGVQYRGYSPTEVKKHATGKGNAGKEQMTKAARDKWPTANFADDNEVDARWILDLATKEISN